MAGTYMNTVANYNKLLFGGPVGSGKTTAISSIADAAPVSTEAPLSTGPMGDKTDTTVAMDYSTLTLDEHTVHLFGLPGQQRFAFMRDILVPGSFGVVLLLDASSDEIYANASEWLTSLRGLDSGLKFAIGVTKTELEKSVNFSLNRLRGVVREHTPTAPVLSVDARSAQDIKQLIRVLLHMK
jgi:signal recognition particle receptor subunit beta